jgi:arylsulfatase A-like enzyme
MPVKPVSAPRAIALGALAGALGGLALCELELALTLGIDRVAPRLMLGPAWPALLAVYAAMGAASGTAAAIVLWAARGPLKLARAFERPGALFARLWIAAIPLFALFVWLNDEVLHPAANRAVFGLDVLLLLLAAVLVVALLRSGWASRPRTLALLALAPLAIAAITIGAALLGDHEGRGGGAPRAKAERPANVIVFTIDTLRAGQLGCYGYPRPTSPTLDALARGGVRFAEARTASTQTDPSHATMFTGLYPPRHGVARNGLRFRDEQVTLAERFRAAGYRTFGAVSAQHLSEYFGFGQGFEVFSNNSPLDRFYMYGRSKHSFFSIPILLRSDAIAGLIGRPLQPNYRRADGATGDLLAWLAGVRDDEPFFAWAHYFDPHSPYEPLPAFKARFDALPVTIPPGLEGVDGIRRRLNLYDGEVAYVDAQIKRVVDALARRGLTRRTLIVVTSDHGESLGEHGKRGHDGKSYEELLRVPLILSMPGTLPAGFTAETSASLADLTPTLLAFVGLPQPGGIDGRVLPLPVPALAAVRVPARTILARSETWADEIHLGAVRESQKLMETREVKTGRVANAPELYDLARDPLETKDLSRQSGARVRALSVALAPLLARGGSAAVDGETRRLLRSLGYIQ